MGNSLWSTVKGLKSRVYSLWSIVKKERGRDGEGTRRWAVVLRDRDTAIRSLALFTTQLFKPISSRRAVM